MAIEQVLNAASQAFRSPKRGAFSKNSAVALAKAR
jgi:hypothetical protein